MARPGRKRKATVKRSKGRIAIADRAPKDDPVSTVRAQRLRDGATMDNWRDQMRGSCLGRLLIKRCITTRQFEAGERWAGLVHRYAKAAGIPAPTPKAVDLNAIRGAYHGLDDPEELKRLHRVYDDAYAALHDAGRYALVSVTECCIRDEMPLLTSLRIGLDALADHFGIATIQKAC